MSRVVDAISSAADAVWDARRALYARGALRGTRVPARVVSVGNLTVGGAGKTTLVLHLARHALSLGVVVAIVGRRYRPGPDGHGDEERLMQQALGSERVFAGERKRLLAQAAARAGAKLVLVDDGFSHWALERDLDIVLLDSQDLWGGGRMFPAGRLREPRRALQRAGVVVISRLGADEDPAPWADEARRYAPAAIIASGRHAVAGVHRLDGGEAARPGRVRVVTATGNPGAVSRTAAEFGFEVVALSSYRDHHWFSCAEVLREIEAARRSGADLLVTAKDAVRWPADPRLRVVWVMEVEWRWITGGEAVEHSVFHSGEET